MSQTKKQLKKWIAIANGETPADTVIKNGQIIDVFNLEIIKGDLAIVDGMFVGIGTYKGEQIIDAENRYICPSFIDGHVHIESSMVTPAEFSKVVLPHGVTTVITDPHEIANVSGTDGINFMLDNSKNIPLDVYFMLPSCVPATSVENSGAELTASDLEPFYNHPKVLGLAEVMDYPSLRTAADSIIDKITMTSNYSMQMDGHLAGLDPDAINVYKAAGIRTDHECNTVEDAKERLRRGMYLLIREGSVAKDLKSLIPVVNHNNARRCLFCTDDKHLDDLIKEGSIDHNVRLAIEYGLGPLTAIQMASLNAAECYGLKQKGAIAPGYEADFLLLDDLCSINIKEVYKSGQLVAREGVYASTHLKEKDPGPMLQKTVRIPELNKKDLQIPIGTAKTANIIEIIPNQLTTNHIKETVDVENSFFVPSIERDQQKLVVIERHKKTGNAGSGIVKGFGLKDGAIATTIAHDSHNIVATGTNDTDILRAVHELELMNGGLVLIRKGEVIASLPLTIAGLMSDQGFHTVETSLLQVKHALGVLGFQGGFNPFLTLSFLTLPVIPALKMTDSGLFDVISFQHIEVSL
ncbi:adenine deaminase [Pseudalkalibacillus sp. R45]|uniref:adenine deaminase n=1 Tax=Pseudalkalibacillus sp. R45 TaxID=3457433 RepID=UPI003FCD6CBB